VTRNWQIATLPGRFRIEGINLLLGHAPVANCKTHSRYLTYVVIVYWQGAYSTLEAKTPIDRHFAYLRP